MTSAGLKLGIAGLGRGFMLTLPALRAHPGVQLAAAFDLRADAVARFADEFGAREVNDFEALFADPEIDAIYIATPHEFHADQAVAALNAGKHVLVEKPMATSVADGARMVAAAAKNEKILLIGPSHGFDESVRQLRKIIRSGRFGPVRMVTALNFTDFLYRPRRPEELDQGRGGGVVYSQATHQIDVVRNLVGQPVRSIRAITGNWDEQRPGIGAYSALMTFAGGAVAQLTYSGYAHYDSDELVGWISELGHRKNPDTYGEARRNLAQFDERSEMDAKLARTYGAPGSSADRRPEYHEHFGFVLVSCSDADIKLRPDRLEIYGNELREIIDIPPPAIPRANVIDEFIAAIDGAAQPTHDGAWGLETMACCAALMRSAQTGADVDTHEIISDITESD